MRFVLFPPSTMPKRKLAQDTSSGSNSNIENSNVNDNDNNSNEEINRQFVNGDAESSIKGADSSNAKASMSQLPALASVQPRNVTRTASSGALTTLASQPNVKLEILPNSDPKRTAQGANSTFAGSQKVKVASNPPKVIMLPDSLQQVSTQKRRRVVRACDRCRKLKIKCSGNLPCIHCTVYSYECTYEQPNRSKRKAPASAAPQSTNKAVASNAASATAASSSTHRTTSANNADTVDKNTSASNVKKSSNEASLERFNSSTVSILASSNPELFSKLTDRLKLYDDILHRLLPEIKLTDLNDNPKPINPMKLMSALNKLKSMGKSISKSSSKQIAKMYESLPEMPLPNLPITKLPPNSSATAYQNSNMQSSPSLIRQGTVVSNSSQNQGGFDQINSSQFQGIDGSLESTVGKEIKIILPSREVALDLITKTWENACVLFRFYHRVAFIEDLNELYDTDPNQYTNKQQRFLPLVYSVMACGALFYKSDENTSHSKLDNNTHSSDTNSNEGTSNSNTPGSLHYDYIQRKDFEDEGYKYFIAARKLIDITDTRDTYGIQTIVMLIIFLQCSARLSTCYAYIGIALRAALREGLHRKLDYPFNPIELEIRKRLFWTIYKMDIYVNTMLGLPRTISSDDFDQDMPIELDDENITVNGYRWDRQGDRLSSAGIANAHTRLIFLMKEVVTKLYPIKPKKVSTINNGNKTGNNHNRSNSNHSSSNNPNIGNNDSNNHNTGGTNNSNNIDGISSGNNGGSGNNNNHSRSDLIRNNFVYDLELKLQDWMNSLPLELKPGVEPPGKYLKANRLLHISYLHVKIILYRPFIHYISANVRSNSLNDLTCIEKAKNCINVARIVVKLAEDMINKNMLSGSYWFSIYTIFFSVACLVYYVHFAPPINRDGQPDQEYIAIKKDAENGKRVLDILKDSSMAARRTYNILNALFEQLNRKTARAGVNNNPQFAAQAGTPEYQRQQQQQQPQQYSRHQHQYSNTSQPESVEGQFKMGNANPGNAHDSGYVHDVNGGIDLNSNSGATKNNNNNNSGNEGYQRFGGQSSNASLKSSPLQNQIQVPRQMSMQAQTQSQVQNSHGNDNNIIQHSGSKTNAQMRNQQSFSGDTQLATAGAGGRQQQPQQPLLPFQSFDVQTPSDKSPNNRAPDLANAVFNDITEYKYVPGPMDQMDMKIFGRFLPPYMLNNKGGNSSGGNDAVTGAAGAHDVGEASSHSHMTSLSNPNMMLSPSELDPLAAGNMMRQKQAGGAGSDSSNVAISTTANALKGAGEGAGDGDVGSGAKNVQQEGKVFQPSLGLFTFVKDNEENGFDREGGDAGNVCGGSRPGDEDRGYSDGNNWIDHDLLETTNDFFNQVTTANAIPSGLSTIFQSESDKNGAAGINAGAAFNDTGSGVVSGGENAFEGSSGIVNAGSINNGGSTRSGSSNTPGAGDARTQRPSMIELPSRFTSISGIGMLDELLFGSGWDNANASASPASGSASGTSVGAGASNTKNSPGDNLGKDTSEGENVLEK